jgi:Integrase core domain
MGIRDRPISPGSPWQNPYVERLIGTVRRECLDEMLVFGEAHLRQILSSYAAYYNEVQLPLTRAKPPVARMALAPREQHRTRPFARHPCCRELSGTDAVRVAKSSGVESRRCHHRLLRGRDRDSP